MPTMSCPHCSQEIAGDAKLCPHCIRPISENAPSKSSNKQNMQGFIGVCLLAFIGAFVMYFAFNASNQAAEKARPDSFVATTVDTIKQSTVFVIELFSPESGDTLELTGKPQPYTILVDTIWRSVRGNRDSHRLIITLAKDEDGFSKEGLTHEDLVATVAAVAREQYAEGHAPVIDVWLMSQDVRKRSNLILAHATYAPDRKGISGKKKGKVWSVLKAAKRGFSQAEQTYLSLLATISAPADYLRFYDMRSETIGEYDDIDVSERMFIPPKTLDPFSNRPLLDYPTE